MKLQHLLMIAPMIVLVGTIQSCSGGSDKKVAPPPTTTSQSPATADTDPFATGDYGGEYGGDYSEDYAGDDAFLGDGDASLAAADCEPGDCPKKKIKIKAIDVATGSFVGSLKGMTFNNSAWGFQGVSSDEGREILLRAESIPADAGEQEQDGVLVVVWMPEAVASGSIKIVARDVSRCIADNSDDEDMQADCSDMDIKSGFSKYEDTKSFSYSIRQDPESKAIEQQEKAAEAAKKQQCMTGLIGGAGSLFGGGTPNLGNLAGAAAPCFL